MTIPIYEANHRNFTLAFTFLHSDISLPVEFHDLNLTETTGLGLELRSKKWYKQTHAPHDSWVCVCVCLTSFLTQATLCALNSSSLVLLLFKSQASSRGKSTESSKQLKNNYFAFTAAFKQICQRVNNTMYNIVVYKFVSKNDADTANENYRLLPFFFFFFFLN